ncbi:hypothetical protein ACQ3G7_03885 [Kosakonia oryzendophytica]|uniref:hypothetical protein n=1 Tax=Kosakonia oryzendophytica TaxID=1005665 RepID=UPI003D335347
MALTTLLFNICLTSIANSCKQKRAKRKYSRGRICPHSLHLGFARYSVTSVMQVKTSIARINDQRVTQGIDDLICQIVIGAAKNILYLQPEGYFLATASGIAKTVTPGALKMPQ